MKKTRITSAVGALVAVALMMAIPLAVNAQDDDRDWLQVRTAHVKPDRVNDYIELQKSLTAALQEADRPGRTVWREVRGDLATFHTVTFVEDMSELDTPFVPPMDDDDWDEWVGDLLSTLSSSSRQILRTHSEWNIPAPDNEEPGLLLLRTIKVKSGKMFQFHGWVLNGLIPSLREGGATGITFNHVAFGGDTSTWIIGARLPNWAALQNRRGNLAHMEPFPYMGLMDSMADLIESTDLRILRYQPDLSFSNQ